VRAMALAESADLSRRIRIPYNIVPVHATHSVKVTQRKDSV